MLILPYELVISVLMHKPNGAEVDLVMDNVEYAQSVTEEEGVMCFASYCNCLLNLRNVAVPRAFICDDHLVKHAVEVR